MSFLSQSFLASYLIYLVTIGLSQAHPMKGVNVRDATSSDHLTFVVSIGRKSDVESHFCTGTLITRQSVLTSEHCINDEDKNEIQITIGSTDLRLGQKYRVAEWKTFDEWEHRTQEIGETFDDIAIITLDRRVDDLNVKPASIQYTGVLYHLGYSQLRIAGWGLVDDNTCPMVLKTGLVKLISPQECIERARNVTGDESYHMPPQYFCSVADPWLLANGGDSGGPTLNEDNKLVAITKGLCPLRLCYGYSDKFRDSNLMNAHLNLLRYRGFIEAVAVQSDDHNFDSMDEFEITMLNNNSI